MSILETLADDLGHVTDRDVKRVAGSLTAVEEGEEVLTVVPGHICLYFALEMDYIRQAKLAGHAAQYDVVGEVDKNEMLAKASRFSTLATLAQEIAWSEARDLVGPKAWTAQTLGLRKDFTMVIGKSDKDEDQGQAFMLPIPKEALKLFRALTRKMASGIGNDDPDEKKKPPQ